MLHRRSCGCTTLDELLAGDATTPTTQPAGRRRSPSNWFRWCATRCRSTPQFHLEIWPGAEVLVAALTQPCSGQPARNRWDRTAWQRDRADRELEALHAALTLLEDTAEQRLAAMPNTAPRPAVVALLRRMRLELIRARLAYEIVPKQLLGDQLGTNYAVSMALLGSSAGAAQSLGWLEHTPATWGCLGLWDDKPASGPATLTIAGVYQRNATPGVAVGQRLGVGAFRRSASCR